MEKLKLLRPDLFQKQKQPEPYVPVVIKNLKETRVEEVPPLLKEYVQTQNRPLRQTVAPPEVSSIAFCFLTYGSIMHPDVWEPYFQNSNIYIHPKYRDEVDSRYEKYIIPTLIETTWAKASIVNASILLLKEAVKKTTNKWFILCSEDSYPLKSFASLSKYLNSQTLSIFNVYDAEINKTSQWFALRREDVELLLQNESEFNTVFDAVDRITKKKTSAVDELFFLSALKQFNPEYRFTQGWVHYVKWLPNVVAKHPVVFNHLLEEDARFIQSNNCLFLRKTFPTFQNKVISKKPICIIICVGSETNENYIEFLNYAKPKADVFVLAFIDFVDNTELTRGCEQLYSAIWNQSNEALGVIYNKFSNQYSKVYVLRDTFNYRIIQYPSVHAEDEWSFLYSQIDKTFRLPLQKQVQPERRILEPVPAPVVPTVVEADEEVEEEDGNDEPEPVEPGGEGHAAPPKTKRRTTTGVGTRKIRVKNKDIAHISPARYVKFGSTPLNQRLPQQKVLNMLAHPMYMNNRKIFISLTNQMFRDYRDAGLDVEKNVSCDDLRKSDTNITLLNHQRIIKDYMNLITPYRGLLLYHGLGAGKTCSSIAIAEGFKTDKGVLVMTPASLNPNYMEELKKCGDEYYKKQQYWEWISVDDSDRLRDTLSSILQLPKEYIDANGGAWVVDVTKASNYDILKRPGQNDSFINANQTSLNNQLNEMIVNKYSFINYNGISATKYEELNSVSNLFDNKIVIIDEAHNFVSRIVNQLNALYAVKQSVKQKSRKSVPMAINMYKDLMSATNTRIVLLTGTPIINYPNEIAVLFNILRGFIKTYEFTLASQRPITLDGLKQHFAGLTMLDYIDYNQSTKLLTITINPFGFETVDGNQVRYNLSAEHLGERQFPARITDILKQKGIDVVKKETHTFTALPDALPDFLAEFIKSQENNMYEFNNPMKFKKRIVGLTSYFRSAQEELLPRYDKATDFFIVRVPMSDFQFAQYEVERHAEREKEQKQKGKNAQKKPVKTPIASLNKEMQMESSSTFKIYSRLLCNFATPAGFIRPKPPKKVANKEQEDEPADVEAMIEQDLEYEQEQQENAEPTAELYKRDLRQFIENITADVSNITGDGLAANSPKMLAALQNIQSEQNDGLHLVYSQFRTYEGIEMFARVLSANGFAQFKIKNINRQWVIDILPEDLNKPKYALYTGTENTDEREILRNIYNGSWKNVPKTISDIIIPMAGETNNMGQHIKILMITAAGSEGINLFNTRFVHLLDPYWNNVRLEQVVGRARRICSHQSLPIEKQTVNVFLYLSVLTETQYTSSDELMHLDVSKLDDTKYFSSDETLYEVACIKENLNTKLLHAVKEASIDCATHVNSSSRENLTCLSFGSLQDPTAFSYLPDITKDVSDEVYKQNVERILVDDYQEITRRDGVKLVRQKSTGNIYTYESFKRVQQTQNIEDLIINTA